MNIYSIRILWGRGFTFTKVVVLSPLYLLVLLMGCSVSPPTPTHDPNAQWMPEWIHPVEYRELPNSTQVSKDFHAWRLEDSPSTWKVRCYRTALGGSSRQRSYHVQYLRGETPLGRGVTTEASFYYDDPIRGTYRMIWRLRGKHKPDFLLMTDSNRQCLLYFSGQEGVSGIPIMTILGVKGIGPNSVSWGGEPGLKER